MQTAVLKSIHWIFFLLYYDYELSNKTKSNLWKSNNAIFTVELIFPQTQNTVSTQ